MSSPSGSDDRLLSVNPEPIKLVPAAVRDVWRDTGHRRRRRCHHEDGRGRCRIEATVFQWNREERVVEEWCAKHAPSEAA